MKIFCEIKLLKEPSLYQQQALSKNGTTKLGMQIITFDMVKAGLNCSLRMSKANAAVAVNVWVEHLGAERDLKYVHV
jgi:hypothetical protein